MRRLGPWVLLIAGAAAGWALLSPGSYRAPRTSFGDPDLQGLWTNASQTHLERRNPRSPLTISSEEAREREQARQQRLESSDFVELNIRDELLPKDRPAGKRKAMHGYNSFWYDFDVTMGEVNGEIRTSWIVDPPTGRVPYSEYSFKAMRAMLKQQMLFENPEQRMVGERCLLGFGSTSGPPMLNVEYNNHYRVVQSPGIVAIVVEMNHDARIIRLGGERLPKGMNPWMGDSVGHFEGDTLVVETTSRHPAQSFIFENNHLLFIRPEAKITERFTRVANDEILYEFLVEDPVAYTQPWRAEMPMRKAKGPMYEVACHEGNRSFELAFNGARYRERKMRGKNGASARTGVNATSGGSP